MALELTGPAVALLDEPLDLRVRGGGPGEGVVWRARLRDDDGRVWRAEAAAPGELHLGWAPAKAGTDPMALQSLRPVEVDVRAELPDGRAAARTVRRLLVAEGVRRRRWKEGVVATLHLPAPGAEGASVLVDATSGGLAVAVPAAALLASRGCAVLLVGPQRGKAAAAPLERAAEVLAAVPGTSGPPVVLGDDDLPPPPGLGVRGDDPQAAAARAAAWDALLARLGGRPREG